MTPDALFALVNPLALVGWAALVAAPRWRHTQTVAAGVVPGVFAVVYVAVLGAVLAGPLGPWRGGFGSLAEVQTLFENPWAVVAGWVHYLAFDLLTGAWAARDAPRRGVPHAALVPCLLLTFLAGPAGWLLYAGVRRAFGQAPTASAATSSAAS